MNRRNLLRAATVLPVAAALAPARRAAAVAAPPTLPEPTGSHPVGTVTRHLIDRSRPDPLQPTRPFRELMVQLWYPARPSDRPQAPFLSAEAARHLLEGSGFPPELMSAVPTAGHVDAPVAPRTNGYPVLLFASGLGNPRAYGTTLTSDLASHGFVVVAIDHTFDAQVVEFPDGRVEHTVRPERFLAGRARVADLRYVLGELARLGHNIGTRLDLTRVGMFGHSAAGSAAANAIHDGLPIRAAANLDGSVLPPASDPGQRNCRPFLQFGGDYHTRELDPTWASYWTNLTGWRRELHLTNARHADFTDLGLILDASGVDRHLIDDFGTIEPTRAVAIQRAFLLAFFTETLLGRPQRLLTGPSAGYPEVTFRT
jgi:dienelactone hydrolase